MSLLDFGDDPVSPNPKPEEGGGGAEVVDPFDPFGAPPSNEQSGGSQNLLDFDPFSGPQDTTITTTNKEDPFSSSSDPFGTDKNDPFGTDNNDPFSDNKSDPFAGDKSDPFASDPFKMDVSATEKQALEAQFDDLLGDFGGGGTTVVENGGTTTKTETVTVVENGETTTTTTTYTSQEFGGAEQAGPGIVPDNDNINSMSPQVPTEKIEGKETRQEEMEIEIKSKEIANNEFDIFANDSEVVLGTEQISREEKKADDIFQNGGQIFENDISIKTVEEQVTIETESKQNDFTVESVGAAKDLSEENNDIFAETKVVNTETADDTTKIKTEVTNTSFETTESTTTVADNGFVVIETNGETTVSDDVTAVNAAETAVNDTVTAGTEAEIVEGNTKTSEINTVIEDNNFDTSEIKAETTENNMETLETTDLINARVSMDVSTENADAFVTENKENTEMANDTQIVETENVDTTTPNFDVSTEQIDITTEVKEIKENYESQQESIDVTPNKTDIPSEIADTEANAETEPQDNIAIAPVIETKASYESETRALDENLENISNIEITSQSEIIENVSNNEIVDQLCAQEKSLIPDSISIPDIKISPDTDNEDQLLDDKTPDNANYDSIQDTVCDEIITSTDISNEEIKNEIENDIISFDSKTLKSETQTEISQINSETTTIKDVAHNDNLFEENANFEIATKETSHETAFESTQEVKTESSDNLLFETNDKLEPEQTETSLELQQDSIKSEAFSNDTQQQDSKVDGFETDVKPLLADSGNVKQSDSKEEVVFEKATKPVYDSFDTASIDSSTAVIDFAGSSEVTVETSADKTNVEIKSIDNISALNEFMKDEIKQHDTEQKKVSNVDPRDDWDIIEMGEKEKIESKKEETALKENIKETVEEPKSQVNEKAPKKSEESKISPIEKQMTKTSDVIEKQTTKASDVTEKQTTKEDVMARALNLPQQVTKIPVTIDPNSDMVTIHFPSSGPVTVPLSMARNLTLKPNTVLDFPPEMAQDHKVENSQSVEISQPVENTTMADDNEFYDKHSETEFIADIAKPDDNAMFYSPEGTNAVIDFPKSSYFKPPSKDEMIDLTNKSTKSSRTESTSNPFVDSMDQSPNSESVSFPFGEQLKSSSNIDSIFEIQPNNENKINIEDTEVDNIFGNVQENSHANSNPSDNARARASDPEKATAEKDQQDDSTLTLEFPTSGPLKPPQKQTNSQNTNTQSQNTAAAKTSGSKKLVLDFPTSGSFKPPKVVEESQGQSEEATTPQQTSDTEADYNSRSPGPRFEDTISDYQPPKRSYSKNEEPKGKSSAVYVVGGGSENMCKVCDKRVYEMEKTIADGIIYHKSCFKCSHCKRVLGLGNFASMDSKLFCKPHFIELFKTKGNYEEGFGMEKRSKQYARREQDSQNGDSASDVSSQGRTESETRELESKDLENGPSIGNIKSRFEGGSQSQSRPESTSSSSGRLNGAQEDDTNVHFTELNNVRNRFESAGRDASAPLPQSRKTPSKWDKPKEPPPPTVNRNEEEEPTLEDELPPQKTTQNLVAKFRSFESSQPQERGRPAEVNQKSVRRMTPPRDVERETEVVVRTEQEVSRDPDIIRAGDEFVREDELPPPDTARNMRAMFQQMANDAPPPSPNRTPSFKSTNKKTEVKVRQPVREEPAPVSPAPRVNGSYEEDGEREEEETPESELPEQGFTRSLVAQWKTKETGAPPTPGTKKSSSTPQQKPRAYQERQQPVSPAPEPIRASQSEQYEMDPSGGVSENDPQRNPDVVREGDTNEEEFLPPPSYTKNLLAKFQSMEQEAAKEPVSHRPSRRKFKWEVKEVKTLRASSRSRERAPSDRDYSVTNVDYEEQQYQNGNHVMENSTDDELYTQEMAQQQHAENTEEDLEELPSHHYTKSMLAKFKSLEDVNRPPPTPEQSARLQKDAVKSASTTPRKFGSTSVVLQYGEPDGEPEDERQQPDGGEYENYRHQEYEVEEYDEEYQSDAVKESDKFEDDLPEQGTTRNLLAKFQSMQS